MGCSFFGEESFCAAQNQRGYQRLKKGLLCVHLREDAKASLHRGANGLTALSIQMLSPDASLDSWDFVAVGLPGGLSAFGDPSGWFLFCSPPPTQQTGGREKPASRTETAQELSRISVGTQTVESAVRSLKQGQSVGREHPKETGSLGRGAPDALPSGIGQATCTEGAAGRTCPDPTEDSFGSPAGGGDLSCTSETQGVPEAPEPGGVVDGPHRAQDVGDPPLEGPPEKAPHKVQSQPLRQETPSPETPSEGSSSSSTPASPIPAVQSLMASKKEL